MNCKHIGILIGLAVVLAPLGVGQADSPTWPATVVSLEGNDWRVAADPNNAGRDQIECDTRTLKFQE